MNEEELDAEIIRINREIFHVLCHIGQMHPGQLALLDALVRKAEALWKLRYG
jgi:hypothetical protein